MNKRTQSTKILISKYCSSELSVSELKKLNDWLKRDDNKVIFQKHIALNIAIEQAKTSNLLSKNKFWREIEANITPSNPVKKYWKYIAVASILIIATLSIFVKQDGNRIKLVEPIIVNNQIENGTDKATLTLVNGEKVTLEKGISFQTQNATSNGEQIVYNETSNIETVYNYLTVPRGGQFQITLADHTKIWLNSESQLKYPVAFKDGETRQVELIYGEAYFDVSPSTEHNGSDFKVYHNTQEVQVLGTEFNIKAYKGETNVYTTLIEGKVALHTDWQNEILAPGEQSNLNIRTNNISIAVVDLRSEISWREGIYIFKRKPLKDIMTVLSRWYDVDVVFANKTIEETLFIGSLNKNKEHSIIDILNDIKNFGVIQNYEINNKTIILK